MKITVKWNKVPFEIQTDSDDLQQFKAMVYSLTMVPVDRQKLMIKSKLLKEGTLSTYGVKEGSELILIGTAEGKEIVVPKEKTLFKEDMTANQLASVIKQKTGYKFPVGLVNLGNTCYMNSSLQCLFKVKELQEFLNKCKISGGSQNVNEMLAFYYRDLISKMNSSGVYLTPSAFVHKFRDVCPMFAEMSEEGGLHYIQQDADEFITTLLNSLGQASGECSKKIDEMFGIEYETTLKNILAPEEAPTVKTEKLLKLSCHIENIKSPINYLIDGIKLVQN